jgi:hypothetical protein
LFILFSRALLPFLKIKNDDIGDKDDGSVVMTRDEDDRSITMARDEDDRFVVMTRDEDDNFVAMVRDEDDRSMAMARDEDVAMAIDEYGNDIYAAMAIDEDENDISMAMAIVEDENDIFVAIYEDEHDRFVAMAIDEDDCFVTMAIDPKKLKGLLKEEPLSWLKQPWPIMFFDHNRDYWPIRYIANSSFTHLGPVRTEVSQYCFGTYSSDGKQIISFTFLPSVFILGEKLDKYRDILDTSCSSNDPYYRWIHTMKIRRD